jgi:hypothetical protein
MAWKKYDDYEWLLQVCPFSFLDAMLSNLKSLKVNQGATQHLKNTVSFPKLLYSGSASITVYAPVARNENA